MTEIVHTDDELVALALEAGWEWLEAVTDRFPGARDRPWTGWLASSGHGIPAGGNPEHRYYKSKADVAAEHFQGHADRCVECGKPISYRWLNKADLLKHHECFQCNIWLDRIRGVKPRVGRPQREVFVAMWTQWGTTEAVPVFYGIGTATTPSSHNGFGGSWYDVDFLDGHHVRTCDLWFGGEVPERFRDRLPVTASIRTKGTQ